MNAAMPAAAANKTVFDTPGMKSPIIGGPLGRIRLTTDAPDI
jgi:hypothetical protein